MIYLITCIKFNFPEGLRLELIDASKLRLLTPWFIKLSSSIKKQDTLSDYSTQGYNLKLPNYINKENEEDVFRFLGGHNFVENCMESEIGGGKSNLLKKKIIEYYTTDAEKNIITDLEIDKENQKMVCFNYNSYNKRNSIRRTNSGETTDDIYKIENMLTTRYSDNPLLYSIRNIHKGVSQMKKNYQIIKLIKLYTKIIFLV